MTLNLGASGARSVGLSDEERSRHLHLIGASGTGKSKLLEHLIRQDIFNGRGLCLLDPHGTLVSEIVRWCASRGFNEHRRIHVIDAADQDWSLGFNPLRLDGLSEPSVRVDAMVSACAQVWGGEDLSSTPRLKKTLRAIFYAIAVQDLTLAEAPALTSGSARELRQQLTTGLPDSVVQSVWDDFNGLTRREFVEVFESTNNRIGEFLTSPLIRRIVGQRERTLDVAQAMRDGDILLVNLLPRTGLSADNVRLLGTLLSSELFLTALGRSPEEAKSRPFTLYIDECYQFLTADIEHMLDQTRKFGLHLVLAHQRLGQLRARSESIYNGVMAGGQTKIAFGGMTDEDAQIMVREIFRGSLNLERPKHVLDKPTVVDEKVFWLESGSESEGASRSWSQGETSSSGSSSSTSDSATELFGPYGDIPISNSVSTGGGSGVFDSESTSFSEGGSEGWSRTRGRSQTLKPVRQVLPTAVHSLEEEMHRAIMYLRELPRQTAIVKRRGHAPELFAPPTITPALVSDERRGAFEARVRETCPFLSSAEAADREVALRREALGRRDHGGHEPDYWVT